MKFYTSNASASITVVVQLHCLFAKALTIAFSRCRNSTFDCCYAANLLFNVILRNVTACLHLAMFCPLVLLSSLVTKYCNVIEPHCISIEQRNKLIYMYSKSPDPFPTKQKMGVASETTKGLAQDKHLHKQI